MGVGFAEDWLERQRAKQNGHCWSRYAQAHSYRLWCFSLESTLRPG